MVESVSSTNGGSIDMSEVSEARLFKALDRMSDRLTTIESQLNEIVRLEERVNSQEQVVHSHGIRLNNHATRLREAEMWQASHGDSSSVERLIVKSQEEIQKLLSRVDSLEAIKDTMKGQKDVAKEVFKWLAGILAAILTIVLTGK